MPGPPGPSADPTEAKRIGTPEAAGRIGTWTEFDASCTDAGTSRVGLSYAPADEHPAAAAAATTARTTQHSAARAPDTHRRSNAMRDLRRRDP
jgi:hypothetical protein